MLLSAISVVSRQLYADALAAVDAADIAASARMRAWAFICLLALLLRALVMPYA